MPRLSIIIKLFRFSGLCLMLFSPQLPLAAQSDKLVLQFNWPVGVVAHVERDVRKTQASPNDSMAIRTHWTYRVETRPDPEGVLLYADSVSSIKKEASKKNWQPHYMDEFLIAYPDPIPNLIFNSRGKCVGISNIEEIKDRIDSLYRPIVEADMQESPMALSMVDELTSERMITNIAIRDWIHIIAQWHGTSLQVGGAPRIFKSTTPNPLVPGVSHQIRYIVDPPERVLCNRGDSTADCLKLHVTVAVDSAALTEVFGLLDETTLSGEQQEVLKALEDVTFDEECTITTDPLTLLPYSAEIITGYTIRIKENPHLTTGTYSLRLISTYRFTYVK